VFYDGPEGQARVLGGGFIARAMAQRANEAAAQNSAPAQPFAAELRG
jgi:tRNA-specific 2-thiouridylase